jgi:hypothetical protein
MDLIQLMIAGSVLKAISVLMMPRQLLRKSRFALKAIIVSQLQRHLQFARLDSIALKVLMCQFPVQLVTTEIPLVSLPLSALVVAQRASTAIKWLTHPRVQIMSCV